MEEFIVIGVITVDNYVILCILILVYDVEGMQN